MSLATVERARTLENAWASSTSRAREAPFDCSGVPGQWQGERVEKGELGLGKSRLLSLPTSNPVFPLGGAAWYGFTFLKLPNSKRV